MNYQFQESRLSTIFRQEDTLATRKLINESVSFTVIGMPGMGISSFLKFLVTQNFAYFIHIDLYELPEMNRLNLYRLIANNLGVEALGNLYKLQQNIKAKLRILTQKHKRVVLVFNRFDQIKDEFSTSFFSNLRGLNEVDKEKIVLIFSSNKPLYQWSSEAFERSNLDTFAKEYYLKPYSNKEMIQLLKLYMPNLALNKKAVNKCLGLSGGHFQLFQLLIKSQRSNLFLSDKYILLQIRRIYEECLTFRQKQQLQKIAHHKKVNDIDPYLLKLGIITEMPDRYTLFSPLLKEYIRNLCVVNLSPLEIKLLRLLKKNIGKITSKDDIFNALWPDDLEKQSDWALNALIYRIRKNPAFLEEGYSLKNHKKLGYALSNRFD